jgi:hypothetical protein
MVERIDEGRENVDEAELELGRGHSRTLIPAKLPGGGDLDRGFPGTGESQDIDGRDSSKSLPMFVVGSS